MKKVKIKKSLISLLAAAVAVTGGFLYAKNSTADFEDRAGEDAVKLSVEKVDRDTVRISFDEFSPLIKSLQLRLDIDGDVNFAEDTINWLVSSDDENLITTSSVDSDKKSMDIVIVSKEPLVKTSGKLEICEIDLVKTNSDSSNFKIIVDNTEENLRYVLSGTNKEEKVMVSNPTDSLAINNAPKIELIKDSSIVEGKIVILKDSIFEPLKYVIATDDEDGDIDKNSITVEPANIDTSKVGSYNIKYSVTDKAGETTELLVTVIVEAAPDAGKVEKPVITINNNLVVNSTLTITEGEDVDLLEGITATDYMGREINVVIVDDDNYDINKPGQYTIQYKAVDAHGNESDIVSLTLVVKEKAVAPEQPGNPGDGTTPGQPDNPGNSGGTTTPEQPGNSGGPTTPGQPGNSGSQGGSNSGEGTVPVEPVNPENSNNSNNVVEGEASNGKGDSSLPATGQGIYFGLTILASVVVIGLGILLLTKKKKK